MKKIDSITAVKWLGVAFSAAGVVASAWASDKNNKKAVEEKTTKLFKEYVDKK